MIQGSISVLLFTLALAAARLNDGGGDGPAFSLADLDQILMQQQGPNWPLPLPDQDDLLFPTLTKEQQKFATNPSYPGFTDVVFGDLTAATAVDDVNDEVVGEASDGGIDTYMTPKRMKALVDPVLANAIEDERINDIYFTTIVGVTSGLAVFVIVGAGFLYHRAWKNAKAAEDVEYPAYGVTGPGKDTSPTSGGDRKLAQNAQLYHYQFTKQQMMACDNDSHTGSNGAAGAGGNGSDNESDGDEDYTVFECPGLAPTGEMEVRNPMFDDDVTPKATK